MCVYYFNLIKIYPYLACYFKFGPMRMVIYQTVLRGREVQPYQFHLRKVAALVSHSHPPRILIFCQSRSAALPQKKVETPIGSQAFYEIKTKIRISFYKKVLNLIKIKICSCLCSRNYGTINHDYPDSIGWQYILAPCTHGIQMPAK